MDETWLPESLYIGLQDLESIVKEVESLLNNHHQDTSSNNEDPLISEAGENILVENHASVLHGTHLVIQELQQITMACIKQGESRLAVPPLDPMLHEWIFASSANVMRIKKCIQPLTEVGDSESGEEMGRGGDGWLLVENDEGDKRDSGGEDIEMTIEDNNQESSDTVDLRLEFTSLQDRTTCIAEFIPILKSQMDEFLADNISHTQFPHSTNPERRINGEGNYSFTPAPSSRSAPLENLRRLLYDLSDEMKACRSNLDSLTSSFTPAVDVTITADINALNTAMEVSVKILAELLSNNASEWIDSMLAGKLSFSEFSTLDQEEVLDFVHDLRGMSALLLQAVRDRSMQRRGEYVDAVDVEAMELGMWTQRIKGLNWMFGKRELT